MFQPFLMVVFSWFGFLIHHSGRAHNDYNVRLQYQSFAPTLASPNRQKQKRPNILWCLKISDILVGEWYDFPMFFVHNFSPDSYQTMYGTFACNGWFLLNDRCVFLLVLYHAGMLWVAGWYPKKTVTDRTKTNIDIQTFRSWKEMSFSNHHF